MPKTRNMSKAAFMLISLFIFLYILDKAIFSGGLFKLGYAKSFDDMQIYEWYRIITGSFFHINILHLAANVFAIYFVGMILENKIGSGYFLLIYFIGNIAESLVWSKFTTHSISYGASPGIYALIACVLIIYLRTPSLLKLRFGTWPLNYLIGYFFLGNLFGLDTLIVHSLGFSFGIVACVIFLLAGKLTKYNQLV